MSIPPAVLTTNRARADVPDYEDAGYGSRNQPFAMFMAGYGNELFPVPANTASVGRSASKARIDGFRGGVRTAHIWKISDFKPSWRYVRLWLLADISKDRELGPLYPRKQTFARQSKKVCL